MGYFDEKIFRSLIFGAILLSSAVVFAQGTGTSAAMEDFALPEYRKGGKLQFILYGKKAENLGAFINLQNPILDMVKKDVRDITEVKPILNQPMYRFGADAEEVKNFWKKYPHSLAFITSERAVYDKNTKMLRGDSLTELRSREMDIQGVGFDAEYEKKFVHIRSKVKVIIRPEVRRKAEKTSSEKTTKPQEAK